MLRICQYDTLANQKRTRPLLYLEQQVQLDLRCPSVRLLGCNVIETSTAEKLKLLESVGVRAFNYKENTIDALMRLAPKG